VVVDRASRERVNVCDEAVSHFLSLTVARSVLLFAYSPDVIEAQNQLGGWKWRDQLSFIATCPRA
jgi:hypothetical protein